jgi:hypothetical protein
MGDLVKNKEVGCLVAAEGAPGLPLTVDLMGDLVKNKEVGCLVAAEGFEGPALDPSAKGGNAE